MDEKQRKYLISRCTRLWSQAGNIAGSAKTDNLLERCRTTIELINTVLDYLYFCNLPDVLSLDIATKLKNYDMANTQIDSIASTVKSLNDDLAREKPNATN